MVTLRSNLKCEVCGTKTLIRILVGWLDKHPIRFNCGKCGILIHGNMYQDQRNVQAHVKFENVVEVPDNGDAKYHIEVSGELLTEKLQPYKYENTFLSPFFKSGMFLMNEEVENFKAKTLGFLYKVELEWPKYRRINELWFNGQYQYLSKEIYKQINNKQFPLKNDLNYLMAVRQINVNLLKSVLESNFFNSQVFIKGEITKILSKEKEFNDLLEYFATSIQRNEEKIFECIKQFVEKFRFMIPVFGINFHLEKSNNEVLDKKGITTVSFEELKQFYVDIYEVITELSEFVIAYNNLKYRGNFREMKTIRRDVQTLDGFKKLSKGAKSEFIDGNEEFDNLVYPHLNNRLRNAIGHNSFKIDGPSQIITYYPKGNENESNPPEISLASFTRNCWDIFQALMNLSELIYQTRKEYYISKGFEPMLEHIHQENPPKLNKRKKQNSKRIIDKQKRKSRKNNRRNK